MILSSVHIRQFLKVFQRHECDNTKLIPAGVLVALFEQNGELHVVLTQRTNEVEHHKGQISFPGGVMDERDKSILDTALREAEEEIGLSKKFVEVLGILSDFQTPSGFRITPIIAFLPSVPPFCMNTAEVTEVFGVPLSFFLDTRHERREHHDRSGTMIDVYFYRYKQYEIWGVTAAILRSFLYDFMKWLESKKTL
jgi:8-oxo-dGTP pyrophosphatase MutT (NUDIX family)